LPVTTEGAQRASRHRSMRLTITLAIAVVFAGVGLAANPTIADAAGKKVVIVVGPVGSSTAKYIASAKQLASQARSYGATVTELYSPNATWSRVKAAAKGANVLIYLGHGNGHPSPYGAFNSKSKDGMGLNPSLGSSANKYYGEWYIDREIALAPNAVVILNRLCYASGNSEPGRAAPTKAVAVQRVDNFGAGFLRANARAVFAEGISSAGYILHGLFKTNKTMRQIFWSDPTADGRYDISFPSKRTAGKHGLLDPTGAANRYYRSVVGDLDMKAKAWRGAALAGAATPTR
jgi:hypothetical protein